MTLTVLVIIMGWFISEYVISHCFETKNTKVHKKGFHIATALQILIHIIAYILILILLYGCGN